MKPFKKKLNSNRGAAMVLALVFLLLCLAVSAAVVTSATVNSGRISREISDRQKYLAVVSAAELISTDIQNSSFVGKYSKTDVTTQSSSAISTTTNNALGSCDLKDGSLLLSAQEKITEIFSYKNGISTSSVVSTNFGVKIPEQRGLPAVTGSLTLNTDYSITVTLTDADGGNSIRLEFKPTVSISSAKSESVEEDKTTVVTTYIHTVTWNAPEYSKE